MIKFFLHLIQTYKYNHLNSVEYQHLLRQFNGEAKTEIDWDTWLYGEGLPPVFEDHYYERAVNLCKRIQQMTNELDKITKDDIDNLNHLEKEVFLDHLTKSQGEQQISNDEIEKLDKIGKFRDTKNSEIFFKWLILCLRARYEPVIPLALDFVSKVHRMKFSKPIYSEFYAWPEKRELAIEQFEREKESMHPVTRIVIQNVMYPPQK
ncbi:hypothetical protein ACOME3_008218 [Neoechinorhynchus agilis]